MSPKSLIRVEPRFISGKDYNLLTVLGMLRVTRRHRAFEGIASRSPMQFEDVYWYRVAKEMSGLPGRRNKQERDSAGSFVLRAMSQQGQKQLIDFKDSQLAAETNLQLIRPKIVRKPSAKYIRALELVARCIKLADKPGHITDKSSNPFSSMVTLECQHHGLAICVRGQMSGYSNGSLIVQVRQNKRLVFSTQGSYMGSNTKIIRFVRGPWEDLISQ